MLDPLLQMCTMSASNLGTADMATYMVNSLYMMRTTLALFEFTDKRLEMLQFQVSFSSPKRKWTYYWFFAHCKLGCEHIYLKINPKPTLSIFKKWDKKTSYLRPWADIIFHFKQTKKWLKDFVWFGLVADKPRWVNTFIIIIILMFICKVLEKKQMEIESSKGLTVFHHTVSTRSSSILY